MDIKTRNKITYASFVLALLIIWHHTYNVEVYNLTGFLYNTERFLLNVCDSSVSLFFVISAFLFYYNLDEKRIKEKLKSRIYSLVIPYLIWNLIGFLYFQFLSIFPFLREHYGGIIEPFSIIGLFKSTLTGDYNLVTWFLRNLIVYTFVFPIIYKAVKKKYIYYVVFVFSLLISFFFASKSELISYMSYYVLGIGFALHHKNFFLKRYSIKTKAISTLIFIIVIAIFTIFNYSDTSIQRIVIYLIASTTLWVILDIFAIEKKPKWWMNLSFIFYVSHEMILEPVEKIILLLLGNNVFGAIIDYVFAPIITSLVIILLSFILKKIPFLWKLLNGSR